MKILMLAPYIYAPNFKEHRKNKTGFGLMVYDIAKSVGNLGNDVVVAVHAFGPKRRCDGFKVLSNRVLSNIVLGRHRGMLGFCFQRKRSGGSIKETLRQGYYYLNIGYLRHLIKREKPEIVHIHGCMGFIEEITDFLNKINVPYVITLHGLLQYDVAGGSKSSQLAEKKLIKESAEKKIPITVISSGMKEDFLSEYYGAASNDHVSVVTNGIDVNYVNPTYSIYEKHNIPAHKKIILCVGSICPTKNQKQLIRSFAKMPDNIKNEYVLLLVGSIGSEYSVREEIEQFEMNKNVFCTGFVPREELPNYYAPAQINVCASIVEGFGLSMVEGFVYGTPCVAFSDIQPIPDIYNRNAMLLCNERSDEAFAETLIQALNTKWDEAKIREHSLNFSLEAMAQKYHALYEKISEE